MIFTQCLAVLRTFKSVISFWYSTISLRVAGHYNFLFNFYFLISHFVGRNLKSVDRSVLAFLPQLEDDETDILGSKVCLSISFI